MKDPDASRLPSAWRARLHAADVERAYKLVDEVYGGGASDHVLPRRRDVFRAFHLTPPEDVRVVILGQDPYPTPGHAHGLAFSYMGPRPFPRSLAIIVRNLADDPRIHQQEPRDGNLTAWGRQGVLLLNCALTLEGKPGSHVGRWRPFTSAVLDVVNANADPVVFLAWGAKAIKRVESIGLNDHHRMIATAHPASWVRSSVPSFRETCPFSEANDFLGDSPVDWRLPT